MRGTTWNDGTAVSYALRIGELVRLELPAQITESLVLSNLAPYATLPLELGLGVLIWNRRARPWVLLAGVAFHLLIEVTMRVGFFSLTMFVYYLAWLEPERVSTWLLALRRDRQPAARLVGH